jgi:hypothetical protein
MIYVSLVLFTVLIITGVLKLRKRNHHWFASKEANAIIRGMHERDSVSLSLTEPSIPNIEITDK